MGIADFANTRAVQRWAIHGAQSAGHLHVPRCNQPPVMPRCSTSAPRFMQPHQAHLCAQFTWPIWPGFPVSLARWSPRGRCLSRSTHGLPRRGMPPRRLSTAVPTRWMPAGGRSPCSSSAIETSSGALPLANYHPKRGGAPPAPSLETAIPWPAGCRSTGRTVAWLHQVLVHRCRQLGLLRRLHSLP